MSRSDAKGAPVQTTLFDEVAADPGDCPRSAPKPPEQDGRSTAVWRQWLSSMASDAEAALAAAIAYREMDAQGREQWLSSLEFDALEVDVPKVALYAPLLAVETDPERRAWLVAALEQDSKDPGKDLTPSDPNALAAARGDGEPGEGTAARALSGQARDGTMVYVLVSPLYLSFSQVLACGVRKGVFEWVRHDPIVGPEGLPEVGEAVCGASLVHAPIKAVLDELAAMVLTHERSGKRLPEGLSVLGQLLGPLGP